MTPEVRCQSGSSGSAGSDKRNGRRRRRRWAPWTRWGLGRNSRCSCPPPRSWHRQTRSRGRGPLFLFVVSFVTLHGAHSFLRRQGRAEVTRGACNEPPRADCGQENRAKMYAAMIYRGRMRV